MQDSCPTLHHKKDLKLQLNLNVSKELRTTYLRCQNLQPVQSWTIMLQIMGQETRSSLSICSTDRSKDQSRQLQAIICHHQQLVEFHLDQQDMDWVVLEDRDWVCQVQVGLVWVFCMMNMEMISTFTTTYRTSTSTSTLERQGSRWRDSFPQVHPNSRESPQLQAWQDPHPWRRWTDLREMTQDGWQLGKVMVGKSSRREMICYERETS